MTKSKNTKRALLASILSIMLCMAMLVGSTFAWFTDSVTSGKNRIVAGNLDVELKYKNASTGNWADASAASVAEPNFFVDKNGEAILWEPGVMAVTQFKVANVGSLALKYSLATLKADFNAMAGHDLSEVIKFAVVEGAQDYASRTEVEAASLAFEDFTEFKAEGRLLPTAKATETDPSEKIFTVVAYWAPTDNDNLYNVNNSQKADDEKDHLYIDIEIQLFATQVEYEKDSFDDQYDKNAWLDHLTANANGTYTDGDKTYVKDNNDYVPIEPSVIDGVYQEVVGEGEETGKLFVVDETSATEIKENETTGLYETVVEETEDSKLYVLGETELVEVAPTTQTSSLYQEVAPEGENSRLYAKGFSGVVEVQEDNTTNGLYTAVGDDSEKFVTTADAMEAVAPQGGNVTVVENIKEINTSNDYFQDPFLNIPATDTPANIDLSDKVLSIDSTSGKNGIKGSEGASATFSNGTITMNKTYGSGSPLIDADGGEITLDHMTVENLTKDGHCVSAGSDGGKILIKDSTVIGGGQYSPAVFCGSGSSVVIENSAIEGAIKTVPSAKIELKGGDYTKATFFSDNKTQIIAYSGLFSENPNTSTEFKVATGSTVTDNGDGTWTVTAAPTAG